MTATAAPLVSDIGVSFTIPAEVVWAVIGYTAIGVIAVLLLALILGRVAVYPPRPCGDSLRAIVSLRLPVAMLVWPLLASETISQALRERDRRQRRRALFVDKAAGTNPSREDA